MNNYSDHGKDHSFEDFTILFDFYLFGNKIEKINSELMLIDEFYFINLEWLQNLKKKFDFKRMEDILNLNFHFDQFFELEQASEKDKYISIFQKLKNDFNYQLNVTEDDFKSIRIINNQKFEKIEEGYMALQNFAFVSQDIIKHFKSEWIFA